MASPTAQGPHHYTGLLGSSDKSEHHLLLAQQNYIQQQLSTQEASHQVLTKPTPASSSFSYSTGAEYTVVFPASFLCDCGSTLALVGVYGRSFCETG